MSDNLNQIAHEERVEIERPGALLLRPISKENFSTFLGDTEYMRVDILSDLERVRKQHYEQAKLANFDGCGCDYCEALSPLFPIQGSEDLIE